MSMARGVLQIGTLLAKPAYRAGIGGQELPAAQQRSMREGHKGLWPSTNNIKECLVFRNWRDAARLPPVRNGRGGQVPCVRCAWTDAELTADSHAPTRD